MITKKELLQMLSDTESYNIERTESTGNMDNSDGWQHSPSAHHDRGEVLF